jgi:hypothetical protein
MMMKISAMIFFCRFLKILLVVVVKEDEEEADEADEEDRPRVLLVDDDESV